MATDRRYVVRERPTEVRTILEKLGEEAAAVREGRVFVGPRRVADPAESLAIGVELRVARKVLAAVEPPPIDVLFEDADFLSVFKPSGIPTVPSLQGSQHALVDQVARARNVSAGDLTVTSRLDQGVSGVVTFAKTDAGSNRIADARAKGALDRRYVALSVAAPGQARGEWTVAIGRHHKPNLRAVDGPDAKGARSRFAVVEVLPSGAAMLALAPETGRTHQLRLHASHAGAPLLGDKDYGGPARLVLANGRVISLARIALHCLRVTLPVRSGGKARVVAPVGGDLRAIWEALGGAPDAWDRADACEV